MSDLDRFLAVLRKIQAFDAEISSGKHKYPFVNLSSMSDADVRTFLEAVDTLNRRMSDGSIAEEAHQQPT